MSLLCLIIRLWLREYRLALSCDRHSAGVCVCVSVCGGFPGLKGSIETGLPPFLSLPCKGDQLPTLGCDGWNIYHSVWQGRPDWQTHPPIPSLFLKLHPPPPPCCSFFSFFLRSSDRASYQHWLCVSYAGSVDNRLFEWHVLIQSHLNDICAPLPQVCHPLSKCHRQIYNCTGCQTKLILGWGFRAEKKIHMYYKSVELNL